MEHMKDMKELYQALIDGKTLINTCGSKLTLKNSSMVCVGDPEQWTVCNEWAMKPAEWYILSSGEIMESPIEYISSPQRLGMKYHTKELAERARDEMREGNILRYWASVIDPEWKPDWKTDWDKPTQPKYYIFKNQDGEYKISRTFGNKLLGTVYMDKETADKICNGLNSRELQLTDG